MWNTSYTMWFVYPSYNIRMGDLLGACINFSFLSELWKTLLRMNENGRYRQRWFGVQQCVSRVRRWNRMVRFERRVVMYCDFYERI